MLLIYTVWKNKTIKYHDRFINISPFYNTNGYDDDKLMLIKNVKIHLIIAPSVFWGYICSKNYNYVNIIENIFKK